MISAAKGTITVFDSDQNDEALANGEVSVAHGYSGAMIVGFADAANPDDFVYIVPDEGGTLWIDNMMVPATADHPCTGFTFMNYLLDAENGAALTNFNYYGSPNRRLSSSSSRKSSSSIRPPRRGRNSRSSRTPVTTRSTSPTIWPSPRVRDQGSIGSPVLHPAGGVAGRTGGIGSGAGGVGRRRFFHQRRGPDGGRARPARHLGRQPRRHRAQPEGLPGRHRSDREDRAAGR